MANVADKAISGRFNVQKAPTLLVMFPDESKKDPNGNVQLAGMQFDPRMHGKFNFGNIASFLDGFVKMRAQQLGGDAGGGGGADGRGGEGGQQQERAPRKT